MTNYTIIEKSPLVIMGIECRTANTPEAAPHDIPKHWARFYSEDIINQIPNQSSDDVIALYCDYEGDYTKPYSLVIGCPVSSADVIPEGMVVKTIPGGSYAVFAAVGEHPQKVIETWNYIWQNVDHKRTYTGDYEIYGDKFFSQSPQGVDVYIAVKKET
jgi:predicted transcriptional regulator YdeE